MDYIHELELKFQERPTVVRARFRARGQQWKIELNLYDSGYFAFIYVDNLLGGQIPVEGSKETFIRDLKDNGEIEDLSIERTELFDKYDIKPKLAKV